MSRVTLLEPGAMIPREVSNGAFDYYDFEAEVWRRKTGHEPWFFVNGDFNDPTSIIEKLLGDEPTAFAFRYRGVDSFAAFRPTV